MQKITAYNTEYSKISLFVFYSTIVLLILAGLLIALYADTVFGVLVIGLALALFFGIRLSSKQQKHERTTNLVWSEHRLVVQLKNGTEPIQLPVQDILKSTYREERTGINSDSMAQDFMATVGLLFASGDYIEVFSSSARNIAKNKKKEIDSYLARAKKREDASGRQAQISFLEPHEYKNTRGFLFPEKREAGFFLALYIFFLLASAFAYGGYLSLIAREYVGGIALLAVSGFIGLIAGYLLFTHGDDRAERYALTKNKEKIHYLVWGREFKELKYEKVFDLSQSHLLLFHKLGNSPYSEFRFVGKEFFSEYMEQLSKRPHWPANQYSANSIEAVVDCSDLGSLHKELLLLSWLEA